MHPQAIFSHARWIQPCGFDGYGDDDRALRRRSARQATTVIHLARHRICRSPPGFGRNTAAVTGRRDNSSPWLTARRVGVRSHTFRAAVGCLQRGRDTRDRDTARHLYPYFYRQDKLTPRIAEPQFERAPDREIVGWAHSRRFAVLRHAEATSDACPGTLTLNACSPLW